MQRKKLMKTILAIATLALSACGGGEKNPTPRHDSEAWQAGEQAAAALVTVNHADTMAMQQSILDAKSVQSRWIMQGDSLSVIDFEEAFAGYLETHDTELYQAIFPDRQ